MKKVAVSSRAFGQAQELEQLRVQLAGCLSAAEGATKKPARRGDYGWSPAYQATLNLRKKHDRLRKKMGELNMSLLAVSTATGAWLKELE